MSAIQEESFADLEQRYERSMERIEELQELLARTVGELHGHHDGEIEVCPHKLCDKVATELAIKMDGVVFEEDAGL